MVLPSRYTLYPTEVLRRSEVPIHLRWTYLVLYALAWVHDYQWLDQTQEQLAMTFTALEGQEISSRGVRQRLSNLAGYGLIERRKVGGRYRTYLLVRHQPGDAPSVTSGVSGDALERHPNSNNYVVEEEEEDQSVSTPLHNKAGDVDRICAFLEGMGVWPDTARRLARLPHVTMEYLEQIAAHRASEAGRGEMLGPGWVVKAVDNHWQPPDEEPDRYRFVKGRFRDYVRR